jgi:hypothetical protein
MTHMPTHHTHSADPNGPHERTECHPDRCGMWATQATQPPSTVSQPNTHARALCGSAVDHDAHRWMEALRAVECPGLSTEPGSTPLATPTQTTQPPSQTSTSPSMARGGHAWSDGTHYPPEGSPHPTHACHGRGCPQPPSQTSTPQTQARTGQGQAYCGLPGGHPGHTNPDGTECNGYPPSRADQRTGDFLAGARTRIEPTQTTQPPSQTSTPNTQARDTESDTEAWMREQAGRAARAKDHERGPWCSRMLCSQHEHERGSTPLATPTPPAQATQAIAEPPHEGPANGCCPHHQ